MRMIRLLTAVTIVIILSLAPTATAEDFYKNLASFFEKSFPGEGFVPTPYGADDRFAPRTIWIYVNNVNAKPWRNSQGKAWIAFSNGGSVYSDSLVPLKHRPINTQTWSLDAKTKWALTAALSGAAQGTTVNTDLDAVLAKNLSVDIDLGAVEVEYAYYFDFLQAQQINKTALSIMTAALVQRYGADKIPDRRVIVGAIKVTGAKITVTPESNTSITAGVTAALQKLGFQFSADRKAVKTLEIAGSQYIAYQSLIADKTGQISTADAGADESEFTYPDENSGLALIALLSKPTQPGQP